MPGRVILTPKILAFLKKNRLIKSQKEMARALGIGPQKVAQFLRENNLQLTKKQSRELASRKTRGRTVLSFEDDQFIIANYLDFPVKTMARMMRRGETAVRKRIDTLGLFIPREIIEQRKKDSQIKPGNIPANKGKKQADYMSAEQIEKTKATRFQKGNLPHNSIGVKDGDISLRYDHKNRGGKPYKYIRLGLANWVPLHKHLWEEKNGPIPENHCLWFIDEDSLNCSLENLELITRSENMYRNSRHNYPREIIPSLVLVNKLKKQINTHKDG